MLGTLLINPFNAFSKAKINFCSPDSTAVEDALLRNSPDGVDGVPHYLIIGQPSKFYIGIGGNAKVTVTEDFNRDNLDPNAFMPSEISVSERNGKAFNISAQQTMLFLNVVGLPDTENQFGVFLSGAMLGDGYAPSLEAAYVRYRGITAGYNYTIFSDNAAMPNSIDYQGPSSATTIQIPQISYLLNFGKSKQWCAEAAVSLPQTSITTSSFTETVQGRYPDVAAAMKFSWHDGTGSIKAAAILRSLSYRNIADASIVDKPGWGVTLAGTTPVVGNLTFFFQGVAGKGVASYIQDLSDLGLDMTPADQGRKMKLTSSWGIYAALQYDFTPKLSLTAAYSHVRNYIDEYSEGSTEWGTQYRYGQYASANLQYSFYRSLSTGIEYLYGRRIDMSGAQAHDSRLQAMLQICF